LDALDGDDYCFPALRLLCGSLGFVTLIRNLGNSMIDGRMAFVEPIEKGTLAIWLGGDLRAGIPGS